MGRVAAAGSQNTTPARAGCSLAEGLRRTGSRLRGARSQGPPPGHRPPKSYAGRGVGRRPGLHDPSVGLAAVFLGERSPSASTATSSSQPAQRYTTRGLDRRCSRGGGWGFERWGAGRAAGCLAGRGVKRLGTKVAGQGERSARAVANSRRPGSGPFAGVGPRSTLAVERLDRPPRLGLIGCSSLLACATARGELRSGRPVLACSSPGLRGRCWREPRAIASPSGAPAPSALAR